MQHPDDYVEDVLAIVESIPRGRVTTYGTIAEAVGRYGARRVGNVMATHGGSGALVAGRPGRRIAAAEPRGERPAALPRRGHAAAGSRARIDMREAFWEPGEVV